MKHIRTLLDLEKQDFEKLFERALSLKERRKKGIIESSLTGKTVGLLFDKPSTRTRVSFEAATSQLGGTPLFISSADTQMSRNEPIKDVARIFSRYLDAVVIRTFSQAMLEEFAAFSTIPVINALTDDYHPCQILSDLMTIIEYKGSYENLKIVWVGDGNNVAHSWINAATVLGLNLVLACPEGCRPDPKILSHAEKIGNRKFQIIDDPIKAVQDADVIYTDVWVSMGQKDEQEKKQKLARFQVNAELISHAAKDVIIMHCLPVHRGEEMTEDVLEGSRSVVWDQAENKLHIHKAILDYAVNSPSL